MPEEEREIKHRASIEKYNHSPKARAAQKKYRDKPESKAKQAARQAEYHSRPEVKARTKTRQKVYNATPERMAKNLARAIAFQQTPKYKSATHQAKRRERSVNYTVLRRYGITRQQRTALIESQGNRCLCCKVTFERKGKNRPCVDHCHTTGRIRGVLCDRCNVVLGRVNDNASLLLALASYVENSFAIGHIAAMSRHDQLMDVDVANMNAMDLKAHERAVCVQAAILSSISSTRREFFPRAHQRTTPLPFTTTETKEKS